MSPLGRSGTIHVTLRAVVLTMDNTGAGIPSGAVENKVQQVSTHTHKQKKARETTVTKSKGDNCIKTARDKIENKGHCYNMLTVKVKYEMKCEMKCTRLTGQPNKSVNFLSTTPQRTDPQFKENGLEMYLK